jgi:hypothetical protein
MNRPILVFAGLALAFPALAAPNMQPGLWEITTKMEMRGMEGMPAMPPMTVRQCIRPTDVQNGSRTVPQNDPNCTVKDYRVQGNTANWRVECRGENPMSGSGTITYNGTSYSGTTKFQIQEEGQTMHMMQTFSGRRVGDCK